jgi:hypothetical protein
MEHQSYPTQDLIAGMALTAGWETAGVSQRHAEVLVGIYGGVVDANFVVKVGTSRPTAFADIADHIPALHLLSRGNGKAR